ncbi:MAG: SEC-C domain-containing protein [Kiritimatiellae bacterium]|nr:SEC-C domain-containing protein [Kiritimatiellia bacterium]
MSSQLQTPKIRRNTPCPCGSGKTFKPCCGTFSRCGAIFFIFPVDPSPVFW